MSAYSPDKLAIDLPGDLAKIGTSVDHVLLFCFLLCVCVCVFSNAMELIFSKKTFLDFRNICQLERLRILKTIKLWLIF